MVFESSNGCYFVFSSDCVKTQVADLRLQLRNDKIWTANETIHWLIKTIPLYRHVVIAPNATRRWTSYSQEYDCLLIFNFFFFFLNFIYSFVYFALDLCGQCIPRLRRLLNVKKQHSYHNWSAEGRGFVIRQYWDSQRYHKDTHVFVKGRGETD